MTIKDHLKAIFYPKDELDLTTGGIAYPLIYLSVPIIITNLLHVAYNLADTFWLGQHSTTALAAISFAFPMVFFLIALGLGVSIAGSVLVAQYIGAGEKNEAEYAASQTVALSVIFSIFLGGFAYVFVGEVVNLLGASESVAPLVNAYMEVYSIGLFAVFGFFVFVSLMRGYGDTVTPMLVMFGSVTINIVLDPFLIFGFQDNPLFGFLGARHIESWLFDATGYTGNGIEGAAIATVFSRSLAFVIGLWIMIYGSRGVKIHIKQMAPDLAYTRRIVHLGAPASVEGTGRALSVNLLLVIIALFPETVIAAFGIGTRIFSMIFLPAVALSQGIETMTGQNIGADKFDRAERTNHFGAKMILIVLSLFGIFVILGAEQIASAFTTDPVVVTEAAMFLRMTALSFGFIGVLRAYSGGFRGAGKTMIAAIMGIATFGVIRFPLAWFGAAFYGSNGIWAAFAVSNVIGGIVGYLWFCRGSWREERITGRHGSAVEIPDLD